MVQAKRVTVLGAGAWGTALAKLAGLAGNQVTVWARGQNLAEAIADCDLLVSAIPMGGILEVVARTKAIDLQPHQVILSTSKGLHRESGLTARQIWQGSFPNQAIAVMSGPNLSPEIMAGLPCATVVASEHPEIAQMIQGVFASPSFRVYTNSDPIGVELGGTLKNVIAIAVGACDGLQLGANAKAALITRSLAEIIRIARRWGARDETFWGLSGLGDLLATCNSMLSRNYRLGYALAQGKSLDQAIASIEGTIEGINTARALIKIADQGNIYLPVCRYVYQLIQGEITPHNALAGLMARDLKSET
jgi:glycerol-3-phosphate dehydrogenase (NAD(P)+)